MKYKFFYAVLIIHICFISAFAENKSILYISDSFSVAGVTHSKYFDMLQSLLNSDKNNALKIQRISRFDINTTECLEFLLSLNRQDFPKALIIMVGESNFHNLYGFSKYIKQTDNKSSKKINEKKTVYELNREMAVVYGVEKENFLLKATSAAYKQIALNDNESKFKPEIIPDFHVLNPQFVHDQNIVATVVSYQHAWMLIREKRFDEAKHFLNDLIRKRPGQSMLYYALGSLYLMEQDRNMPENALKAFEDGILVDPYNKDNICYKGLILLYMMYKGEITAEILYFARVLNSVISDINDEISAILAINTVNYDKKMQVINKWILYDLKKIREICEDNKINFVISSYPEHTKANQAISEYVISSDNVLFFANKEIESDNFDSWWYNAARNLYNFLKDKKIIN